eukprot:TRINITY_DN2215_c0_g1_i7.p1 TRINITY_DN2215_c0_g1~~TRINITY_DN2215_c0_g1_i7.p1  ORF type:complete len:354 (+),score=39.06 TRINITY_DN2215_c0_g1_i7:138-1199(+)
MLRSLVGSEMCIRDSSNSIGVTQFEPLQGGMEDSLKSVTSPEQELAYKCLDVYMSVVPRLDRELVLRTLGRAWGLEDDTSTEKSKLKLLARRAGHRLRRVLDTSITRRTVDRNDMSLRCGGSVPEIRTTLPNSANMSSSAMSPLSEQVVAPQLSHSSPSLEVGTFMNLSKTRGTAVIPPPSLSQLSHSKTNLPTTLQSAVNVPTLMKGGTVLKVDRSMCSPPTTTTNGNNSNQSLSSHIDNNAFAEEGGKSIDVGVLSEGGNESVDLDAFNEQPISNLPPVAFSLPNSPDQSSCVPEAISSTTVVWSDLPRAAAVSAKNEEEATMAAECVDENKSRLVYTQRRFSMDPHQHHQ